MKFALLFIASEVFLLNFLHFANQLIINYLCEQLFFWVT